MFVQALSILCDIMVLVLLVHLPVANTDAGKVLCQQTATLKFPRSCSYYLGLHRCEPLTLKDLRSMINMRPLAISNETSSQAHLMFHLNKPGFQ